MRIVTWNIRAGGGRRVQAIAKRLARWRPSIVALCEFRGTPPSQALAARLAAMGLTHQRTSVDCDYPAQNALLIASRWPLRSCRTPDAPNDPRRWLPVRVGAPEPFDLGAMHIPNKVSGRKYPFHDAVTSIADRWGQRPAILLGDTNSGLPVLDEEVRCFGPREEAFIRALDDLGWADAFRHLRGRARAYSWYSPNGGNGFRLDQAFLSPRLAPQLRRAAYLWGSARRGALSDHAALLLDLADEAHDASTPRRLEWAALSPVESRLSGFFTRPDMPDAALQYVLAIDLGTSGPKAAVVSSEGRLVAIGRASVKTIHLPDRGIEQDPNEIWDAVKQACKTALSNAEVDPKRVAGIICSSQYSSIVPVDKNGQPTMNMILWLDQRGDRPLLRQYDGFPKRVDSPLQMLRWLRIHGMPPLGEGSESLSHMRFVKFARPEVYGQTDKFLEPMDFLSLRFTGRAAANQSTMFMSLLVDNRTLNVTNYDSQLVEHSLIDIEKLPELLPLDAPVGTVRPDVADELGLSPKTVVFTGLNDTQSGGMATYAFTGDHAGLSVGSSSVIITHVQKKKSDVFNAILTMPSPVPDTYFVMAENGVAGGSLEHFLRHMIFASDHFGEIDQADEFQALGNAVSSVPPGSDKVLFLPWMSGSLAPSADSRMRGGFLNLSMRTTRSHMARAVLEGVSMNLRWLKGPAERFAKRQFSHFIYYGGGAESDEWSQIMADVLERPVHQMADPQYATCLGAGLLACQRLGFLGFDDFAKSVAIKQVYEPRQEFKATYDELFEQFVAAFKSNRKIFRRLNARKSSP